MSTSKKELNSYISNFRRLLSGSLKPGVSIQSIVYPYTNGTVIVFEFHLNALNRDEIRKSSNDVKEALERTKLFEDDAEKSNQNFSGTNILLISNKIVVIKDDMATEWTSSKVESDVDKILKK